MLQIVSYTAGFFVFLRFNSKVLKVIQNDPKHTKKPIPTTEEQIKNRKYWSSTLTIQGSTSSTIPSNFDKSNLVKEDEWNEQLPNLSISKVKSGETPAYKHYTVYKDSKTQREYETIEYMGYDLKGMHKVDSITYAKVKNQQEFDNTTKAFEVVNKARTSNPPPEGMSLDLNTIDKQKQDEVKQRLMFIENNDYKEDKKKGTSQSNFYYYDPLTNNYYVKTQMWQKDPKTGKNEWSENQYKVYNSDIDYIKKHKSRSEVDWAALNKYEQDSIQKRIKSVGIVKTENTSASKKDREWGETWDTDEVTYYQDPKRSSPTYYEVHRQKWYDQNALGTGKTNTITKVYRIDE